MDEKHMYNTFTSANILLLVNDTPLGGVSNLLVEDVKDVNGAYSFTRITMDKIFVGLTQDLVELMRKQNFTFKLMNTSSSSGWVAPNAHLERYEISVSAENNSILQQKLVVWTDTFDYGENITEEYLAAKEQEDIANLINILKKNQEAFKHTTAVSSDNMKTEVPSVVLPDEKGSTLKSVLEKLKNYAETVEHDSEVDVPDEDLVWLNASDPEQVKDVKPRKLKKKKKNK